MDRHLSGLARPGNPPASWQHEERTPSTGPEQTPLIFEFFWADLPHGVPPLVADHDWMIAALLARLEIED